MFWKGVEEPKPFGQSKRKRLQTCSGESSISIHIRPHQTGNTEEANEDAENMWNFEPYPEDEP